MPTHQHGLRGLSIVITGAGSGIGRALAQGFLRDGARVVAADIREEGLAELEGAGALAQRCDVSRRSEVKALVEEINQKRREKYATIAKKRGTSVKAVAALAGAKLVKNASPGEYVMTSSGKWSQKPGR